MCDSPQTEIFALIIKTIGDLFSNYQIMSKEFLFNFHA